MLKLSKKITAAMMAGTCILSSAIPGSALNENLFNDDYIIREEVEMDPNVYLERQFPKELESYKNGKSAIPLEKIICRYVKATIPLYLDVNNLDGEYDVSEPYKLNNFDGEDAEKYFVVISENNKMVASLTVGYDGDNILSVFRLESIPVVDDALTENKPIAFGYSNDCFIICSDETINVVDNPKYKDISFVDDIILEKDDYFSLKNKILSKSVVAYKRQPDDMEELSVIKGAKTSTAYTVSKLKTVPNALCPDGEPLGNNQMKYSELCWAACIASIANHKRGMNYSATGVYYACKNCPVTHPDDRIPHGNVEWEKYALKNVANIKNISYKNPLTYDAVENLIKTQKPIYISIKIEDKDETSHAVVICGCKRDGKEGIYKFMDPGGNGNYNAYFGTSYLTEDLMTNGRHISFPVRWGENFDYWNYSLYET